jgi:hypothetical protein
MQEDIFAFLVGNLVALSDHYAFLGNHHAFLEDHHAFLGNPELSWAPLGCPGEVFPVLGRLSDGFV